MEVRELTEEQFEEFLKNYKISDKYYRLYNGFNENKFKMDELLSIETVCKAIKSSSL